MAKRLKSKDLLDLVFVSDPQIHPSGDLAAAVVTTIVAEEPAPRYRSRIRLYDIDRGGDRAFTSGEHADTHPRFSPDGRDLAYLSVREENAKPQLAVIALDGGEGRVLTRHRSGVSALCWHPGGRHLAYLTRGDWHDEVGDRGGARSISSRRYKLDGVGFLPSGSTEVRSVDLGNGEDRLIGSFELGATELAYDGRGRLYLLAPDPEEDRDTVERGRLQIWRISATGKRSKRLLRVSENISGLSPAPDGSAVAYLAPSVPHDFTSPTGVWTLARKGGRPTLLSGDFEASPSLNGDSRFGRYGNAPVWSDTADELLVNLNCEGRSGLARLRLDGTRNRLQLEPRAVTAFAAAHARAVFIAETPTAPGELFARFENGGERQLSSANAALLARHRLQDLEGPFQVGGDDGAPLRYWAMTPDKPRKDRARVIEVHGGPHTNYGYGFVFEFQLLTAAGYTVVFGNPRGSSSFGTAFAQAMLGGYGGIDADDVLAICDDAAQRYGDAPEHLTGGSYGGFMTNWLVGRTDRFASAVTQRSISNWLSFFGSSDIGYDFTEREIGGVPWRDLERLWQQSPLRNVERIATPLLIVHAEQDHRCPIEQAEQLFVALATLGKAPTELLRFPDEGHELSRSGRPDRRIERLDALVGWFERYPARR